MPRYPCAPRIQSTIRAERKFIHELLEPVRSYLSERIQSGEEVSDIDLDGLRDYLERLLVDGDAGNSNPVTPPEALF